MWRFEMRLKTDMKMKRKEDVRVRSRTEER
jgi:hypothetical protein